MRRLCCRIMAAMRPAGSSFPICVCSISAYPIIRDSGVRISWETPWIHWVLASSRLSSACLCDRRRREAVLSAFAVSRICPASGRETGSPAANISIPSPRIRILL